MSDSFTWALAPMLFIFIFGFGHFWSRSVESSGDFWSFSGMVYWVTFWDN